MRLVDMMKPGLSWLLPFPLIGVAVADLCPGNPGGPTVHTPGVVDCFSEATATGTRTTYTFQDNAILGWGLLELPEGDELVFDFVGGDRVANVLGPGRTHRLDGAVTSNGTVGFFSEGRGLEVNGQVTARGVVLSSLAVDDATDFLSGGSYQLSGNGGIQQLTVRGDVTATAGDVLAAGNVVRVAGEANLNASGAVRVAAGNEVDVADSGPHRVQASGGIGILLHLGDSRASTLELVTSGQELNNAGRLEAAGGAGRIFLEVGPGGTIRNEGTGVILGNTTFNGIFDNDGIIIGDDDLDPLQAVNSSVLDIPALKDPKGRSVSMARRIETNTAMSGSADALRPTSSKKRAQLAKRQAKPLVRRQSFFGMRGGKKGP